MKMYYHTGMNWKEVMTIFGYWRCSTDLQDQERQVLALRNAGAEVIYGDKITGTSDFNSRPELIKCLDEIEEGSTLLISELSRLSRSFLGMVNEVSKLIERGIHIKTLDKRLDTTAMPKEITMLIVSILGYAASQELEQIKSRTAEGREVAKNRGVKFGMKRKYDKHQIQEIMSKRNEGQGYGTIGRAMGMSRATIQSIVKREMEAAV
jgi:DNA invertase Pin-like site-specific DNA recombinase|tara:strand:- start:701 stop:1324 length:624 start_codon:yes stop_codon:yes gene_type:complete